MRNYSISLVAAAVLLGLAVPVAWGVDAHHAEPPGTAAKPAAASPAAPAAGMDEKQMLKMQDSMLKMHEQMHKIMQATDPKERERLKQEHMKMMREHMDLMHGPGGMMGGDMGRMMHSDQPMPPAKPQGDK